jgi:hypothetical protein
MAAAPQQPFTDPVPLRIVAFLEPALERLIALADLKRGWDSYDAEPISPIAVATARGLLMLVVGEVRHHIASPVRLHVLPLADGGVQLEWLTADASLEIEVRSDGTLGYLMAKRDADELVGERDGVAVDEILERIRDAYTNTRDSTV